MELKIFNYIDEATKILDEKRPLLKDIGIYLNRYFHKILLSQKKDDSSITFRIKSSPSLKEKIIRHSYYKKYTTDELFYNLSDLIGIRIQCRFIEDENKIYKTLKKHFNKTEDNNFYYNISDPNIKIDLSSSQPQKQKNGFKIYRIDGLYESSEIRVNFELQIKSLVNMFWSEIEHELIYKNYNYMPQNDFITNIMSSIKNNLTLIDDQMNMLYNQISDLTSYSPATRIVQIQTLVSKLIFDIYYTRMKSNMGFIVDFRNSCNIVANYIFKLNNAKTIDEYNSVMLKTIFRLNSVSKNQMNFSSEIYFERQPRFDDEFSRIVGNELLKVINSDFEWNLLFRMLFEIQPDSNVGDFETFIKLIKDIIYKSTSFTYINSKFNDIEVYKIKNQFINTLAHVFKEFPFIQFLYDYNINAINNLLHKFIINLFNNKDTLSDWNNSSEIYLKIFRINLLSILDCDIDTTEIIDIIDKLKLKKCKFSVSPYIAKYTNKLSSQKSIKASHAVQLFKFSSI